MGFVKEDRVVQDTAEKPDIFHNEKMQWPFTLLRDGCDRCITLYVPFMF
jgi:hypothetical protein